MRCFKSATVCQQMGYMHGLNVTSLKPDNDTRCITMGGLTMAHLAMLIYVKLIEQVIIRTQRNHV